MFEKENVEILNTDIPIKTYIKSRNDIDLSSETHIHDEIELIYMLDGEMNFYSRNNCYKIRKNEIILINSFVPHSSVDIGGDEVTRFCLVQFDPKVIYRSNLFNQLKYLTPFVNESPDFITTFDLRESDKYNELSVLLLSIVSEYEKKELAYELEILSILYRILTLFYRWGIFQYNRSPYTDNTDFPAENLEKLKTILEYVENNYNEDLTLDKVCAIANYSYHYFCKLFKRATGKTFIQYLNFVRISNAERLLITTDLKVTDILLKTGFSSFSYFNRVFKDIKKCTPSVYRTNQKD